MQDIIKVKIFDGRTIEVNLKPGGITHLPYDLDHVELMYVKQQIEKIRENYAR